MTYKINGSGPNALPWATPILISREIEFVPSIPLAARASKCKNQTNCEVFLIFHEIQVFFSAGL